MNPRIAIVDKNKCHPTRCSHECIKHDPLNKSGGEGFHLGPDGKATIAEEVTMEAHAICAKVCPFSAIKIVRLPAELEKDPIHKFSENGFRLYNLPTPTPGKVVGLLGRNGIGKSTAIQILSNIFIPNLGKVGYTQTINELIARFKGTETQRYFEQIRDGKLTFAYKPQAVDNIPKQFKGTVRQLLEKVTSDVAKIDDAVKRLGLSVIADRDISKISGGELQRLAIAATALKSANVYFFDEPTSYLDIYQRLEVAKYIRDLATENVSVVVIEHDLIILDAIADIIHIVFGEENAYGVISGPKPTKAGINMYLDGMLPQENIRFRDSKISFKKGQEKSEPITVPLTGWPQLVKRLGDFTLHADEGILYRHEVVGVLGQNGIGKTTFVKMLAGILPPDEGSVDTSLKVSYKPQYLDGSSELPVMVLLADAIKKYHALLIKPLQLEEVYERPVNQLSGGLLQRVAIAHCLSQEADIFLLDEPSAYLDAEQRLMVSKVLKEFMLISGKTAIVVDHDLLFVDYLSNRLFVFSGEPGRSGHATGPHSIQHGMNLFLQQLGITFRRDEETHRPRANKVGSQLDQQQKLKNVWYYA